MATNPWTCLRTHARTLCTHATHAASAMVLCLGLTTTAASAAGGGDMVPLAGGAMALTVEQQAMLDDMASQAEVIYEIASGQRPVLPFEPLVLDWFALDEDTLDPSELFTINAAQIAAGVFAGGTLASDPEVYMEVQFDRPFVMIWEDAGEAGPIPFPPADADEPRVISMGMVRGSLIGQEGAIDEVTFAVVGMEFWTDEGPMGVVGIVPIGIGLPWPEEEGEVSPEITGVEWIIIIIGGIAVVVAVWAVFHGVDRARLSCLKQLDLERGKCRQDCATAAIQACQHDPPEGHAWFDCDKVQATLRRCNTCCTETWRYYRYNYRGSGKSVCDGAPPADYTPISDAMKRCSDFAEDPAMPLPGDPPSLTPITFPLFP